MKNLTAKFNNAFFFLYSLLIGITPLLMYHKTSEIFEFNKLLFIYFITLLISTLWLARMIIYKKIIFKNTVLTIPLVLFFFSQCVATYFSIDRHTSIFGYYGRFNGGLLSTASYLLLFFAFVSNIDQHNRLKTLTNLIKVSLISSTIVILWGLPSKFGFDLSCLVFTGSSDTTCWTNEFQPTIRMFSTLGQPNWLGAYLVVNFFFALYLYLAQKIQRRWLLTGYLFLNVLCIFYTRSRSALLAFGIGIALLVGFIFLTKMKGKKLDDFKVYVKKMLAPIALVIIVAAVITTVQSSPNPTQPEQGNSQKSSTITDSFEIRKLVWQGGYSVGMQHPWFGTGVETFAYSYNFLRPVEHNMTSEWDFVYNKAHNELINYFTTTGLLGLVAYLFMLGIVISRIKPLWQKSENVRLLGVILLIGYGSLVVSNFFGFSTTTINVLFYLMPGFIVVLLMDDLTDETHQDPESITTIQKAFLAFPALLFIYGVSFISLYFMADVHYARGENYRITQEYDQALFYLYYADSMKPDHVYKDKISQVLAQKGFYSSFLNQEENPACPTPTGASESCFLLATKYNDETLKASPKNVYYLRSKARNNFLAYQATRDEADFDTSIDAITQAQNLAPTDPRYPYMKSLFFLGRYDTTETPTSDEKEVLKFRAPGPATSAIKLKPDYKDAYITRGMIYAALGEYKDARADFQYVIDKIDSRDEQAHAELTKIQNL